MRNYTNEELINALMERIEWAAYELKTEKEDYEYVGITVKSDGCKCVEEFVSKLWYSDMPNVKWIPDEYYEGKGGFYRCDTGERLCRYNLSESFYIDIYNLGETQWNKRYIESIREELMEYIEEYLSYEDLSWGEVYEITNNIREKAELCGMVEELEENGII